ncbi:MAG: hypothetical protein ISR57_08375 [Bacteroidales bacterium]|nr:hypothetical protein [Bacteroidales bacterium]
MIDWIKKTAAFILILPVLMLVLHDAIPHHHHTDGIHGVVCSHHDTSDCEDGDYHGNQPPESHVPCDIENCEACHFADEFVIDDTYRKSLSILPPNTLFSFHVDNPIQITTYIKAIDHERGCLLTFNKRGPPTKLA